MNLNIISMMLNCQTIDKFIKLNALNLLLHNYISLIATHEKILLESYNM